MSALALAVPGAAPRRAVVLVLARQEARRLLLHPFTLLGFGVYVVLVAVQWPGLSPRQAFETTCLTLSFFPGVPLILAANLVATREHRAGGDELLAPVPARAAHRWAALALAGLAPALLGLALQLSLHVADLVAGRYPDVPAAVPTPWQLLGGPVTLLGACLLGTALGLWFPARTAAVVAVVALVALDAWVEGRPALTLLNLAVGWAAWGVTSDAWAGVTDGSPAWHVTYLLGLCALAAAAGWLRVARRRPAPVLLGAAGLVAAVLAGAAQLP